MSTMNAAVVTEFGQPPRYARFAAPVPSRDDEFAVDVLAVGLHPRTRSGAAGTHYTSTGVLPMIPGIDGVGQRADGRKVYFVADDDEIGTMADRFVVDPQRCLELPDGVDVLKIAAGLNPAMSAWVALRRRVPLEAGQSVLVLGATGNAGSMAVQVAKRLGAGQVVAAGRDRARLEALSALGADVLVQLSDDEVYAGALAAASAEVDIVIDYLWGQPAERAITALLTQRGDRSRALNWIQIGAMAGPAIALASVALRSANFRLQGSGQGAVSPKVYRAELPALVDEIDAGRINVTARPRALADVERIWGEPDEPGVRTVLVP